MLEVEIGNIILIYCVRHGSKDHFRAHLMPLAFYAHLPTPCSSLKRYFNVIILGPGQSPYEGEHSQIVRCWPPAAAAVDARDALDALAAPRFPLFHLRLLAPHSLLNLFCFLPSSNFPPTLPQIRRRL